MDVRRIEKLKGIVDCCKQTPSLLHTPPLAFFKNFLESLGARILTSGESVSQPSISSINGTGIEELKGLVDYCKQHPSLMQTQPLAFFKNFLLRRLKHPKIVFMMVDFDNARDIVAAWDVRHVPIFYFVKNGLTVEWLVTVVVDGLELSIAQHSRF